MAGELIPKLRFVRCPRCLLILQEPPGCDLYKCGECDTLLRARRRTSVVVNSESSVQETDAAPTNALNHVSEGKQCKDIKHLVSSRKFLKQLAYLRKNMSLIFNQILRWLMQPEVWRSLCFVSSVIGLFCYALSSSFNQLLGKWTWWKILLYIVFSFTICLTLLVTTARQRSASLQLEAHLAFLVLIITSVYSFFFDKVVNGKPDAYSLISCAAFAIASLALSRLTQCGFEIDLLYFFCGGLIVQLMKIKLWLIFVGGSFCYSLIILRSCLDTPGEHLQLEVQNQNQVIIQVDSDSEEVKSPREHLQLQAQNQKIIQVDSDSGEANNGSAKASAIWIDSAQANTSTNANIFMPQKVNIDADTTLDTPPENCDHRFQDRRVIQSNSHSQDNGDDQHIQLRLMVCIKALEKENQCIFFLQPLNFNLHPLFTIQNGHSGMHFTFWDAHTGMRYRVQLEILRVRKANAENQMLVHVVSSHVDKYLKAIDDSESKDEDHILVPQLDHYVNLVIDI